LLVVVVAVFGGSSFIVTHRFIYRPSKYPPPLPLPDDDCGFDPKGLYDFLPALLLDEVVKTGGILVGTCPPPPLPPCCCAAMTSSNVVAANGIADATSWVSDDCKSPFAAGSSEIGLLYGKSDLDCGGATGFDPPNGEKDFFMVVPTDAEPPPMELKYDPFDAVAATVDDCCGCDCGDGTAGGGITFSLVLLPLPILT
jgi:hypothetical protein